MTDYSPLFGTPKTIFNEADDAPQQGAAQAAPTNTGAPAETNNAQQTQPADNTQQQTQNADQNQQDQPNNEDNNDFNIDTTDDIQDTGGDDLGGGGSTGGGSQPQGTAPEEQVDVDNEAKRKDREIFDALTPQEQKVKTIKLKELYMELYDRCTQIIDKYESIGVKFEDLERPIQYSLKSMYALKDMISTYMLYLFDSKSYIENDITFNRFLTIMNQIKLITKDMKDAHKDDIDEVKNNLPLGKKKDE